MIRYVDFGKAENYPMSIPHKVVTMEEAVAYYRKGKTVAMIDGFSGNSARAVIMDNKSIFTADFDYMVNCDWVVFGSE